MICQVILNYFYLSYQPPHVRRRLKVQELVSKYRTHMTEPELLTYLFHDPPL